MNNSPYDENCPYWQQPEHIAYYSNLESTYQEEQGYGQISNYGSYETNRVEATVNEQGMAHSHNQDWSEETQGGNNGGLGAEEELIQELEGGEEVGSEREDPSWGEEPGWEPREQGQFETQRYEDEGEYIPDWEPTTPSAYVDYSRIHPNYLRHPELPHWHHFNHPPSPLLRLDPELNPPQRRTPVIHHTFCPLPDTQPTHLISQNPSE